MTRQDIPAITSSAPQLRVALCCSMLQVLNAAAAMRLDPPRRNVVKNVLCIHHGVIDPAVPKILKLGELLGFDQIFDFTTQARKMLILQRQLSLRNVLMYDCKDIMYDIDMLCCQMRSEMELDGDEDFEVYCRPPRQNEAVFLRKVLGVNAYHHIEDGSGDYLSINKHNKYRVRRAKATWYRLLKRIALKLKNISTDYLPHTHPGMFVKNNTYMIHPWPGARCIGKHAHDMIREVTPEDIFPDARVLVLGALFDYKNDANNVIKEYIGVVRAIAQHRNISLKNILYRPHHRTTSEEFQSLRNSLPCPLDTSDLPLAECVFTSANLEAVYSHASTASIHAKMLFNLESYFIDTPYVRRHQKYTFYAKMLSKQFNIPLYTIET